jgi:hypothetical protein
MNAQMAKLTVEDGYALEPGIVPAQVNDAARLLRMIKNRSRPESRGPVRLTGLELE